MWFASYGGGVSKFDKVTVFTTSPLANKTRRFFPLKVKCMLVLNRAFLFDIKTKVVSPQVPTHKEDFICISFFSMKEKYIFPIFDGLYKIDETGELPRLSLSC
jgi:hypothetical protein